MVCIPTVPDFSSLNLAAAVQIMAYEVRQAALDAGPMSQRPEARSATAEESGSSTPIWKIPWWRSGSWTGRSRAG